jgi:F-type H+-transporting ATPase subunit a
MAFHSPIEQFEIHNLSPKLFALAGQPVAFTNSTLAMFLAVVLAGTFMVLSTMRRSVIPGRWQVLAEAFFNNIESTLVEAAGEKAKPFMPFIFTLFMYIFFCNMLGLFPQLFTVTAQLIVNFALAMTVITIVLATGFAKHGFHFLTLFLPKGAPPILLPFLGILEFISFFVRPCSLSLRLFGNMLAGHILLKVFAGMCALIATAGWAATSIVFPVVLNIAIIAFEVFVALLQAYIFTVLSSVYLRDAIELH